MKSQDALLLAWANTLGRRCRETAIFDTAGESARSFEEIEVAARNFEDRIGRFDPGTVIAIQIGNHPAWPEIFLACLRHNVVVLPLETSISDSDRGTALKICRASAVVAAVPGGGDIAVEPLRTAASTDWNQPPSLLKLTSGTTATPRAVRFTSEQLIADCEQICDTMGISDNDLNFGVIPVSHSYGFSNLLTPLIVRGVPMVLSRDRLPRAVLVDLARTNATVFPGMPVFYQAFCEMKDVPALPALRLCISAGAPLRGSLAKTFHSKFGQPIHSFYGSSECGGICYDRDGTTFEDGFVGEPMKNVDIDFVEPNSESSQIRVRSATVADGYFPEPDEAKLGSGIFVPDDLLVKAGRGFKIVGRISDVINVAGKKVNPAQIEEQLLKVPGVREAIAFARKSSQRNEEVNACVVAESVNEAQMLQFCREHLSGWQVPKRIFIVSAIPVNERGKISRKDLAARFAAG